MEMYPWRGASRSGKNCWSIRGSSFNVGFQCVFFHGLGSIYHLQNGVWLGRGFRDLGGFYLYLVFHFLFGEVWCGVHRVRNSDAEITALRAGKRNCLQNSPPWSLE